MTLKDLKMTTVENDMNVIDNFLPEDQFQHIQNAMLGPNLMWNYNAGIVGSNDPPGSFQFTHTLFDRRPPWNGQSSQHFPFMMAFLEKLEIYPDKLYRIKANLRTKTISHSNGGYHIDDFPCPYTAVFYVNSNNGYTKFKKSGEIVKSVANRIVIFNSDLEHGGYSCTDENIRVVINFNWT